MMIIKRKRWSVFCSFAYVWFTLFNIGRSQHWRAC